jgi:FKBP-type peptidyl-prolyl cis-trans isomerase
MVDYLNDGQLRIEMSAVDSILNLYLLPGGTVDETAVPKKDASYAIGLTEAQYLVASLAAKGIDQEVDVWFLVEGIKAGMNKDETTLTMIEARMEVAKYYDEINLKQGQQFLETNGKRDSVQTTASGMQYQVISQGKGIVPNLTDSVVVHYTGYFIDGRAFESTIPSGQPQTFIPLGLIPGWQEALTMMKEGSKYRLYLPYQLAYGEKGSGPIPPYSTLVFDLELIKVIRFS